MLFQIENSSNKLFPMMNSFQIIIGYKEIMLIN